MHKNLRLRVTLPQSPGSVATVVAAACFLTPVLNAYCAILARSFELQTRVFDHEGKAFATTVTEGLKLLTMMTVVLVGGFGGVRGSWTTVCDMSRSEMRRYALPAVCYCVDNILTYVALSYLRPHTVTLLASSKILVTAVLFRFFLGRTVPWTQWLSLVLLCLGICVAELMGQQAVGSKHENFALGVPVVAIFVVAGAFANIWVEYLFQDADPTVPFPVRNARLYVFGVIVNAVVFVSMSLAYHGSVLHSFTSAVVSREIWEMSSVTAVGGLCIAIIFNYANNIVFVLLQGATLPVTILMQWMWFGLRPTFGLLVGAGMVSSAIIGAKLAATQAKAKDIEDEARALVERTA